MCGKHQTQVWIGASVSELWLCTAVPMKAVIVFYWYVNFKAHKMHLLVLFCINSCSICVIHAASFHPEPFCVSSSAVCRLNSFICCCTYTAWVSVCVCVCVCVAHWSVWAADVSHDCWKIPLSSLQPDAIRKREVSLCGSSWWSRWIRGLEVWMWCNIYESASMCRR